MSFLDDSFFYNFQQSDFVQKELRVDDFGLIRAVQEDTPMYRPLTPPLEAYINQLMDRQFEMPAIKEQTPVIATVESFTIPENISESEKLTATLVSLFSGFFWCDALIGKTVLGGENMVSSKEEYFVNKVNEICKAFAIAKEQTTYMFVDGRKTQVLNTNPGENDGYDFITSELQVSLDAQQERMFPNLQSIGRANGMPGATKMVSSYGVQFLMNYSDMFGAENSKNLQNQGFIPQMFLSNRVIFDPNTQRWVGYLWEDGSFAYVNNFKHDFVVNKKLNGGSIVWDITPNKMPYINEQVMTFFREGPIDASALSGTTAEWKMTSGEEYAFFHRYLILGPYNSDIGSRFNPVIKVVGLPS